MNFDSCTATRMKHPCVRAQKRLVLLHCLDEESLQVFLIHSNFVLTLLLSAAIAKLLLWWHNYNMGKKKKSSTDP